MSTRHLEIAFFGSSLLSAYWNGAATYYRGILRALASLGHRIVFYEPDAYDRQKHRDMPTPSWATVVVYSGSDEREAMGMLERARRSDVIVKASGVGVFDELLEREVPRARRPGSRCIFWDVDAAATLERVRANPTDPLRALVRSYDMVLTCGGGPPVVEAYRALGARECVPIYNALDPETHFPVPALERWSCDLALLANRLPDRERRVDEFFFRAAHALPDKSFLLGGAGWEDKARPPNVRVLGHVYTDDHNVMNSSARAVLNVARDSMARNGWSPATRVFEAAGAAACIITDDWLGLSEFFEPGREVLVAKDGEEVASILRELDFVRAATIGAAARARVLSQHTYALRARMVDALLAASFAEKELAP